MTAKNTICVWYDKDAEAAARFYAKTFPDSSVGAVHRAPADFPSGKKGDVLTVEFTVMGIPCLGLNGGPAFTRSRNCNVHPPRRAASREYVGSASSHVTSPDGP
jgi:predicted 3-demethylubiquinone-9 3-methyltransferase (glyoxalase superfamily)